MLKVQPTLAEHADCWGLLQKCLLTEVSLHRGAQVGLTKGICHGLDPRAKSPHPS